MVMVVIMVNIEYVQTGLTGYCDQLQCDEKCEVGTSDRPPYIVAYCLCTVGYMVVRVDENLQV